MKNKLNAVDFAESKDSKVMPTWDMIDTMDYLKEPKILVLVNSINIQNQELFIRTDKFVFPVLKQACSKNVTSPYEFRTSIIRKMQ